MSEKNNGQNFSKCIALENTKITSTNSGYKKKTTNRSCKIGNSSTLTILRDGLSIREGMTEDRVRELQDNKKDLPNLNKRGDIELKYISRAAGIGGKHQSIHHQNPRLRRRGDREYK